MTYIVFNTFFRLDNSGKVLAVWPYFSASLKGHAHEISIDDGHGLIRGFWHSSVILFFLKGYSLECYRRCQTVS